MQERCLHSRLQKVGSETPKTTASPTDATTPAAASEEASAIGTHDAVSATGISYI